MIRVTWTKTTDRFTDAGEVEGGDLDALLAELRKQIENAYVPDFDEQVKRELE